MVILNVQIDEQECKLGVEMWDNNYIEISHDVVANILVGLNIDYNVSMDENDMVVTMYDLNDFSLVLAITALEKDVTYNYIKF